MRQPVFTILLSILMLLIVANAGFCQTDSAAPLRVMTFNIRYNNPGDGPDAWPNRKEFAASMVRFHHADIAGLQEALKGQLDDLDALLPGYDWFGVGRDDGKVAGEYAAVLYRPDRVTLLRHDTFWLSETPSKPGFGWDAKYNRIVTWGQFRDRTTGREFYLFNTHFDHQSDIARRESSKLLLQRVTDIAGDSPVIVTGDFNSEPDSEPYQIISDSSNPAHLTDAVTISEHGHHGPQLTFSAFKNIGAPGDSPIDHIFIKNDVRVLLHGTLSDTFDGRFPSDHMPVLIEAVVEQ